ncbi:Mu transposase C-terminal domain-containing protein [Solibacillus silvestris]
MIPLAVNDLVKNITNEQVYRILWIDESNLITYIIDIDSPKALPKLKKIDELSKEIIDGEIIKLEPNVSQKRLFNELSNKEIEIRNKAWDLIKELVQNEPSIYITELRGKEIRKLQSKIQFSKTSLYNYLRRYWQGGKTINTLLPMYNKSGARGKQRGSSEKKRGRPRLGDTIGINITEDIKEIFRKGIRKYYLSDKKNSLVFAYKMTIRDFFASGTRYENGVKYITILDKNSIPTFDQFRYWYKQEFNIEHVKKEREGIKSFERNNRAILGSSTYETLGPGSRYQIDATIADVYLISNYNSDWIVGRPIVYYVVDVYSRMITGVYIGFEGPSWAGMMMAIANAASDKKEFCSKYGINILEEWWPSAHLPEIILGDRGELEGHSVNNLVEGLNISIENTPSYRPDWKGIVEKLFDTTQSKIKPFLPGFIQKDFGERGATDYRLEAKLTLEQYTKIIINFVLYYNKNFYAKDYTRDIGMIEENIKPTPLELWKWGIKNRAGKLRVVDNNIIKFYLMPKDKATVTPKGIKFKGMLYSCETALKESWFVKSRVNKSWKVDISYDPRNVNNIYMHTNDERIFESCALLNHQERYIDRAIEEVDDLRKRENIDFKDNEQVTLQEEINFYNSIESIIEDAVKDTNKTQTSNLSKAQKTKSIRVNRHTEKSIQRDKEAFDLTINSEERSAEIIEIEEIRENNTETKVPSIKDLFNQRREKNNK